MPSKPPPAPTAEQAKARNRISVASRRLRSAEKRQALTEAKLAQATAETDAARADLAKERQAFRSTPRTAAAPTSLDDWEG